MYFGEYHPAIIDKATFALSTGIKRKNVTTAIIEKSGGSGLVQRFESFWQLSIL